MRTEAKNVLFLEPFYGGSHRDFADGLIEYSCHRFDLRTLPARFWKWRLRGASLHFASQVEDPGRYDLLLTSDLLSLADLKALWGTACPPALVYFHENQLTYPLAPGERMDLQYGFTDITTCLAADRVLFNSYSHFDSFFETLPGFLRQMPEYRPWWVVDAIRSKSGVQHPGCRFAPDVRPGEACAEAAGEPLIVWNHRWEFDKDPAAFFRVLARAGQAGARFRLALMGENFQVVPGEFIAARKRWAERIVQYGYVESRQEYYDLLGSGAVVVSTALQENFGISVVEAVRHGCLPLLPHRLSYPELLPEELHAHFLYRNEDDLVEKLVTILGDLGSGNDRWAGPVSAAVRHMGRFSWACRIDDFDREIARSAG